MDHELDPEEKDAVDLTMGKSVRSDLLITAGAGGCAGAAIVYALMGRWPVWTLVGSFVLWLAVFGDILQARDEKAALKQLLAASKKHPNPSRLH